MNSSKIKKLAHQIIATETVDSIKVKFLKDLVPELLKMPVVNDEFPIDVEIDEKLSEQQVKSFFDKDTRNNKKLEKIIHNPSAEYVIEKFKATNSKTTFTINWVPDFYDSESELEEMLASKKKATKKASDKKEFMSEDIIKIINKMMNMSKEDLKKALNNTGYFVGSKTFKIIDFKRTSDLRFGNCKDYFLEVVYDVESIDISADDESSKGNLYVQFDGTKIIAEF